MKRCNYSLHAGRALTLFMGLSVIVALMATLAACNLRSNKDPRAETPMVSVEGSDTMETMLEAWRKAFMKENPTVPVSVTCADSGKGIRALIDRTTDVAAASRDITTTERALMHNEGMKLSRSMVALDSIAVIVNPKNQVNEITIPNLLKVYSGEITDWGDLGGVAGDYSGEIRYIAQPR